MKSNKRLLFISVGLFLFSYLSVSLASTSLTISNLSASPSPFSPNGDGRYETTAITYSLSEQGYVTTEIYDSLNTAVRTIENNVLKSSGSSSLIWNGKDDTGQFVESGVYTIKVNANDLNGNPATEQTKSIIVEKNPATLISPPEGSVLAGTVTMIANVSIYSPSYYNKVVFYYKRQDDTSWGSAGSAIKLADGSATILWDTTQRLDGAYKLKVSVINWAGYLWEESPTVSVSVDNPIHIISVTPNPSPFSPNGDGIKETTAISYTMSEQGYVTTKIYDSSDNLVRTLENVALKNAGSNSASWNGKDDSGQLVDTGVYLVKINAQDLSGNPAIEQSKSVIVERNPAILVAPPAGSVLAGTVSLVATISSYAPTEYVWARFSYLRSGEPSWTLIGTVSRQPDNTATLNWDTTQKVDGAYKIKAAVVKPAIIGYTTWDESPSVSFTIDNRITISNVSVSPSPFGPNSNGIKDSTLISYNLSEQGYVTAKIYDSSDNLVRTLENVALKNAGSNSASWNGKDDTGQLVDTGVYLVKINAQDLSGNPAIEQSKSVIVERNPAVLVSPTEGSVLAGTVSFAASVSAYAPTEYGYVQFLYQRQSESLWNVAGTVSKQPDNTATLNWDTTQKVDGAYKIKAAVVKPAVILWTTWDESPTTSVSLDNSLPSSSINAPATGSIFNIKPILVSGSCSDPSGSEAVQKVQIRVTDNKTGQVVQDWIEALLSQDKATWSYHFSPTSDGSYQIQSRAVDVAGNTESPSLGTSVIFDTTAPATTDNSDNQWHKTDITVNLSSNDQLSGVYKTYYQIDSTTGSWIIGNSPKLTASLDHANDGIHTLYYYSADKAGNVESVKSAIVKIDTTSPTTAITISDPHYGDDPVYILPSTSFSLVASDAHSGLLSTLYKVDQGEWKTYLEPFNITTAGEHTIYFKSTDNVGLEESEKSQRVFVDVVSPQAPTDLTVNNPRLGGILNLSWQQNPEPDIAGYNLYRTKTSGGSYTRVNQSLVTTNGYQDINLTNGLAYYYVVTAVDRLGAESDYSNEGSAIPTPPDVEPPIVSYLAPTNGQILNTPCAYIEAFLTDIGDAGIDLEESNIVVTVFGEEFPGQKIINQFSDSVMFFPSVPFPDNDYTITVTPVDKAGNQGMPLVSNFTIDTKIPETINTLSANSGNGEINLRWLAPSDEGPDGRSAYYLVKKSENPIYDLDDFNRAQTVFSNLAPGLPGTDQSLTAQSLINGKKYYFAIRSLDSAGNLSQMSNVVSAAPMPDAVYSDLAVSRVDENSFVCGESTTFGVKVKNTGNVALTIADISTDFPWVSLASPLPMEIDPGREREVTFNVQAPSDITEPVEYDVPITLYTEGSTGQTSQVETPLSLSQKVLALLSTPQASAATISRSSTKTSVKIRFQRTTDGELCLKVVDSANKIGLPEAVVVLAVGNQVIEKAYANSSGNVVFSQKTRGNYVLSVYKEGYAPTTKTVFIPAGKKSLDIGLDRKQFIMTELVHHRLTLTEVQQLISQGVLNLNNPENFNVYKFDARITVRTPQQTTESYGSGYSYQQISGGYDGGGGGGGGGSIAPSFSYATIVVPVEVKFLKEMFEATLIVRNGSDQSGIVLSGMRARLNLPANEGLVLTNTTVPQAAEHDLGDIQRGRQKTTSWILTGEKQGDYYINANLAGRIMPFDEPFDTVVCAKDPIKVYAGSLLKVITFMPDRVAKYAPFKVRVRLQNIAPVSVYFASVKIDKGGLGNCFMPPGARKTKSFVEIKPGHYVDSTFSFVALVEGKVVDAGFNTTGGNVELQTEIWLDPSLGPSEKGLNLYADPTNKGVILTGETAEGASSYEIYRATQENFSDSQKIATVNGVEGSQWFTYTDKGLNPDQTYWYIVNTDGEMLHNMVCATPYSINVIDLPERTGHIIQSDAYLSELTIDPYDVSSQTVLNYSLLKNATNVRILIYDENSNVVKNVFGDLTEEGVKADGVLSSGSHTFGWGRLINYFEREASDQVLLPPSGYYKFCITAEAEGLGDSLILPEEIMVSN